LLAEVGQVLDQEAVEAVEAEGDGSLETIFAVHHHPIPKTL